MRARFIVAAGVLTAAVAACSDQPKQTTTDTMADRELAMPAPTGRSVASDIEVYQPAAPEAPAPVQAPARRAETPPVPAMDKGVAPEAPTPAPVPDAPVEQPAPVPAPAAAATPHAEHHAPDASTSSGPMDGSVNGTLPGTGRGPMIVIRGGRGSGIDPCIIHVGGGRLPVPGMGIGGMGQPGGPDEEGPTMVRPEGGALVNERAPKLGVGGKNPGATRAVPTRTTGGMGGGMTGGMGGRSRGGIR